jgi:hypothetical protein
MTDSTGDEREALATVLASAYSASPYRDAHLRGADAILAAGYRRQVCTLCEASSARPGDNQHCVYGGLHAWHNPAWCEECADG